MSGLHSVFGPAGNSIAAAILAVAVYAIVARTILLSGASWAAMLITMPVSFVGAMRSIAVRPLMLELLYVALLVLLIRAYVHGRVSTRRFLACVVIGGIIWANTHGSFLLLPVILFISAVELALRREWRWRPAIAAAVLACASFVVNPWGIHLYSFAVQSVRSNPTLSYIQEWQAPNIFSGQGIPVLIQIGLIAVGFAATVVKWKDDRAIVGFLLPLPFIVLALQSGRHIALLGIVAAQMMSAGADWILPHRSRRVAAVDPSRSTINMIACGAVALSVIIAGWANVSTRAQRRAMSRQYPAALMPVLKREYTHDDRLLNQYDWGGYLISQHVLPVFIDGRSELYGNAQLERYAAIIHLGNGWQARIDSLGVNLVLMSSSAPLAKALSASGWNEVASDSIGVLLRKPRA